MENTVGNRCCFDKTRLNIIGEEENKSKFKQNVEKSNMLFVYVTYVCATRNSFPFPFVFPTTSTP